MSDVMARIYDRVDRHRRPLIAITSAEMDTLGVLPLWRHKDPTKLRILGYHAIVVDHPPYIPPPLIGIATDEGDAA